MKLLFHVLINFTLAAIVMWLGYGIGKRTADRWYAGHQSVANVATSYMSFSTNCTGELPCQTVVSPKPQPFGCIINSEIRFDVGCAHPLPVKVR
jgi:hypothetical protein